MSSSVTPTTLWYLIQESGDGAEPARTSAPHEHRSQDAAKPEASVTREPKRKQSNADPKPPPTTKKQKTSPDSLKTLSSEARQTILKYNALHTRASTIVSAMADDESWSWAQNDSDCKRLKDLYENLNLKVQSTQNLRSGLTEDLARVRKDIGDLAFSQTLNGISSLSCDLDSIEKLIIMCGVCEHTSTARQSPPTQPMTSLSSMAAGCVGWCAMR